MITFFRKIRQKLLNERRFGKYLTYAVGEIMLVMIGILLALQVNNWNEERKKESIVAAYKKSLTEDLTNEIIKSKSILAEMEDELNQLLEFGDRISKNPMNFDSIVNMYRIEFNHEIKASKDINLKTLDGLVATGNISLLDKDLYSSLIALNDVQEKTIQAIELNINFYMIYSTRVNLPFNDNWNAFEGEPLDSIWKNVDRKGFLRDFNATLSSKVMVNKFIIRARKELLSETESVLRKLTEQNLAKN